MRNERGLVIGNFKFEKRVALGHGGKLQITNLKFEIDLRGDHEN
jgi:hypothetical protein